MIRAGFETTDSTDSDSNSTGQGRGGDWWTWVGPRGALSGGRPCSKSRSCPRDLGRDVRDPRGDGRLPVDGGAADVEERRERSIQKGLAATLGRLAEALGYRGVDDRYVR